jgi:hypothetical protein
MIRSVCSIPAVQPVCLIEAMVGLTAPEPVEAVPDWALRRRESAMDALLILAIYIAPFIVIVIGVRLWMRRRVSLSDVQAEGDPKRGRSRFLYGFWRRQDRDQL